MLSQENIDKLHMNGIYRSVLACCFRTNDPYRCNNWTFQVRQSNSGEYYMIDTYRSINSNSIKLTDENFYEFEYLFDLDDVRYFSSYDDWLEYPEEDRWIAPMGSGGRTSPKFAVRRGAKKVKQRVIDKMCKEIDYLKYDLAQKERILEGIIDGSIDWNLY